VSGGRAQLGLLAAALVGVLLAAAISPFPAVAASSSDEGTLVSLTNAERANRGIHRLSTASDLAAIAERHSRDMASHRRIYHDDNLPYEVSGWRTLGENVGRGPSARSVHDAFMSSSVHRAHILNTTYTQIGVGAVRGGDNYLYVTEVFAGRGAVHASARRTVHRRRTTRRHHVRALARPRPVLSLPCRSVGMLLTLLALDEPETARTYIPGGPSPP
jgi:Cysteine-rich secretory protein family